MNGAESFTFCCFKLHLFLSEVKCVHVVFQEALQSLGKCVHVVVPEALQSPRLEIELCITVCAPCIALSASF